MLIQHSTELVIHRLARIEGKTLEASQAMIAKIRGDLLLRQARDVSETPETPAIHRGALDKSA